MAFRMTLRLHSAHTDATLVSVVGETGNWTVAGGRTAAPSLCF